MAPRDDRELDLDSAGAELNRLRHRPPAEPEDGDQDVWLISYADMVTLLFAMFVILLAIASMKGQSLAPAQPVTEPAASTAEIPPAHPHPDADADEITDEMPERLADRWLRRFAGLALPGEVTIHVHQDHVAIEIGEAILFASGQADLSEAGRAVLTRLVPVLASLPGAVVVEGHTDRQPIASLRFPSNWELSAARAAAVVRLLIDQGLSPQRLSAVGYADTRPLAPGDDPAAWARNRRVTLMLRTDGAADDRTPPGR